MVHKQHWICPHPLVLHTEKLKYHVSRFLNHGIFSWGSPMHAISHYGVMMRLLTMRLIISAIHGVAKVLMIWGWN